MKSRWQFSLRWFLALWIVVTIAGVIGRRIYLRFYPPPPETLALIVDYDEFTSTHVRNLLQRADIQASFAPNGGGWVVRVSGLDIDRAKRLLAREPNNSRPAVQFSNGSLVLEGITSDEFNVTFKKPLADVLAESGDAAKYVRIIASLTSDTLRDPKRPIVRRVYGHRRYYLRPDGTYALGVVCSILLWTDWERQEESLTKHYLIWDDLQRAVLLYDEPW